MNRLEFMDYDTYNQIIGGSLADYLEFLKENPTVVDPSMSVQKASQKEEKKMEKTAKPEKTIKNEDYRYTIGVIVLETYLPRFEMKYGEFKYSSEDITNEQRYMELKNYFNNICEVNSIDDLIKKSSYKSK